MGKVFTWDEIHEGAVPRPEDFEDIGRLVRASLSREPSILSVVFCGSYMRRDHDVRSDIDCVVLYDARAEAAAMLHMQDLVEKAHVVHVPINFVPCDHVVARTAFHALGPSFARHLRASIEAGGQVKGDLMPCLAGTIPEKEGIRSYIRMKLYNLQEAATRLQVATDEEQVRFLKKLLESATHVARKVLVYEGTLQGDSKREVRERYLETMPRELSRHYEWLLTTDYRYTQEVKAQVAHPDEHRYQDALQLLAGTTSFAFEFLRRNIIRLNGAP